MLIVGGGINGAGIARDWRPDGAWRVVLAEKDDLASHTSSSTADPRRLRYLEYYEFALVRKALAEREVLLRERAAHHVAAALRDAARPGMRPVWMIRAGLFLYDHLARREVLPGSTTVDLRSHHPAGAPLKPRLPQGLRSIPTAGSTTRAWWCSTRSMRRRAAPPC